MSRTTTIQNLRALQRPWHLLLLPLFTLGHAYNALFGFIPFSLIVQYLLLVATLIAVVFALAYLPGRRSGKASGVALCVAAVFLFYGPISDAAAFLAPKLTSYKLLPILLLLGASVAGWFCWREPARRRMLTLFVNVLLLLFVLIEAGTALYRYSTYMRHHNRIYTDHALSDRYQKKISDSTRPDIFLLVMDEYGGPRTLQRLGHNNQPFLDSLKGKGFWVQPESRSNYDFTPFSVSSLLQMEYIDSSLQQRGDDAPTVLRAIRSVSDNQVLSILRKEGYEIRFEVPFDNCIQRRETLNEFGDFAYKQLFGPTFAGRLQRDRAKSIDPFAALFPRQFSYDDVAQRRTDLGLYRSGLLQSIDSNSARPPRFVYQHLLITHHPYLFGPDGQPRQRMAGPGEEAQAYIDQVRYANKVLLDEITRIRKSGRRNTVILLLSDHGYRASGRQAEAFENLYALYMPGCDTTGLGQTKTPVNAFRQVFNRCFGQSFPLLAERSVPVHYK